MQSAPLEEIPLSLSLMEAFESQTVLMRAESGPLYSLFFARGLFDFTLLVSAMYIHYTRVYI